ncbi:MAG: diguanylate cyclase [Acidobacteriota bacterium]
MPEDFSAPSAIVYAVSARGRQLWRVHIAGSTAMAVIGAIYAFVKVSGRAASAEVVVGTDHGAAAGPLSWVSAFLLPVEAVAAFGVVLLLFAYLRNRRHLSELLRVAECAQQELQLRFADLFRFSNEAVFLLDAGGVILEANQQAEKTYGYSRAELVGIDVSLLRAADVRGNVAPEIDYVREHGNLRRETIHVRKDGTRFPVEFSATAIHINGKLLYQDIVRDIGEQKRADEKIREATEQMGQLVRQLEERNRQNGALGEMREFLLACSTLDEIGPVVARSMRQLLPSLQGALFLLSPSKTDLETAARWGGFPETLDDNLFAPDSCWGLRRGVGHVVDGTGSGLVCPHLKQAAPPAYACLPLMARGDVFGLLHIRMADGKCDTDEARGSIAAVKELAATVAEVLSLSIWNIRLRETLSNQAINDQLTGLYNRAFMEEALQREVYRASRMRSQVGVVLIDVDRFKQFNDTYGHAAGDLVLAELANLLKWRVRKGDVVCRYGGEEFVLILPDSPGADTVERAESLRESVKGLRVSYSGQDIGPVTVSMGVAQFPLNGSKTADLLRAADIALYQAKQQGRDRVVFVDLIGGDPAAISHHASKIIAA